MANLVVAALCIPFLWSCGQDSQPKSLKIEPDIRVEEQAPPQVVEAEPMMQQQMPVQKSIKSRVDSKLNTWCEEEVARLEEQRGDASVIVNKYLDLKIKRMKKKCLGK